MILSSILVVFGIALIFLSGRLIYIKKKDNLGFVIMMFGVMLLSFFGGKILLTVLA